MLRNLILAAEGAALLAAASLTGLSAETTTAPPGLEALRRTANYQQAVVKGAQNSAAWINKPCQEAKAHFNPVLGVLKPPVFDDKGNAQSGTWIEHVTFEGCSLTRILNVVVSVQGQGQLGVTPMLPGTSHADPILQKDAVLYAFTAAKVGSDSCKPTYIANAAFVDVVTDATLVPSRPSWVERWTVAQCDKLTDVELHFTPDAKGTVISARLKP